MKLSRTIGKADMKTNLIKPPLFEELRNYLTKADPNKQIFLFIPYIKTSSLKKLIDGIENKIIIITNWSAKNLIGGSSELKLYPFCKKNDIALYHNDKIHLKVYSVNLDDMILATGNISQHGLMQNGNLELATFIDTISNDDRLFLEQIRKKSTIINDPIYEQLMEWAEKNPPIIQKEEKFPEIEKSLKEDDFLISALPMTKNIEILVESYDRLYQGMKANNDEEINNCVYHDLANYEIPLELSQVEFLNLLKTKFFEHPFIQRIDQFLKPCAQFGQIKEWVQQNCHDVPIPSRRELTGNIQVLYKWFEELGDGKYVVDVPGTYSERLCKVTDL